MQLKADIYRGGDIFKISNIVSAALGYVRAKERVELLKFENTEKFKNGSFLSPELQEQLESLAYSESEHLTQCINSTLEFDEKSVEQKDLLYSLIADKLISKFLRSKNNVVKGKKPKEMIKVMLSLYLGELKQPLNFKAKAEIASNPKLKELYTPFVKSRLLDDPWYSARSTQDILESNLYDIGMINAFSKRLGSDSSHQVNDSLPTTDVKRFVKPSIEVFLRDIFER